MPTMEEYAKQPTPQRIERLARTPEEIAAAVRGVDDARLSRRPDERNWAPKEVVCHLRDTDESFMGRFETIMAMDEPKFVGLNPDRWAEDRQYLRCDTGEALAAFRRRRQEIVDYLRRLRAEDYVRAGVHATRGRLTIDDFVAMMAWHDDNHLAQLRRALEGKA